MLARRAVPRFSTRYSRKRFTLRQHVVLLLTVKKTTTYCDLVDELIEMPRIRDALELDSIPRPSTLCDAFDRLEMGGWRVLLIVSLTHLLEGSGSASTRSGVLFGVPPALDCPPCSPARRLGLAVSSVHG